jgi:hypothetical protein
MDKEESTTIEISKEEKKEDWIGLIRMIIEIIGEMKVI